MLNETARRDAFFAANAWLLASFGGLVNAAGRVGTGLYSDSIGRANAYLVNGLVSAVCLFLTPIDHALGQRGAAVPGGRRRVLAIRRRPVAACRRLTADYFGSKNLGFNYGLVFIGWGIAFFVPQLAGYIKDVTGSLDYAFYLSGGLLLAAVVLSLVMRRPADAQTQTTR